MKKLYADFPYWRLSAFYFFYYALLGGIAPYWGLFLKGQGFGPAEIGQLMAILMLMRLAAPNFWGWLADVGQCRLALVRCGSFLAFAFFSGFLWLEGYWAYAFLMTGFSFFWTAVLPQFEVITLYNLGAQRHHYSRVRMWGSIGFILVVVGLGQAFEHLGLEWLPLCLLVVLGLIWFTSLAPLREPRDSGPRGGWSGFLGTLKQRPVAAFLGITFLLQLSHGPYYTFYSIYLQSTGYGFDQVGLLWSLGVVAEVVLFLFMHRVLAHHSVYTIILLSAILTALRWLLVPLFIDSGWLMMLAQLLHAFSFGAIHAASIEFVYRYFRNGYQGQGQALYSSIGFGAGGAVGAFVSGYLYQYGGGPWAFGSAVLAAALAVPLAYWGLRGAVGRPG